MAPQPVSCRDAGEQERAAAGPARAAARIACTPRTIQIAGRPLQQVSNPIARALEQAAPGCLIELAPGDYPAFAVGFSKPADDNAATPGGEVGRPITVRGSGRVRIRAHAYGGDTIAFVQQVAHGHLTFENLEIEPSYRSAVMFYQCGPAQSYPGFRFLDCSIVGGWNHLSNSGRPSKWGVWGQGLKDFEFRGVRGRARIEGIQAEHAFYLQNPRGDLRIENVDCARVGRTFCQITARPSEGPPGLGRILVKGCRIEDACIAAGDGFKGGAALTFAGRLTGTIWLEKNTVRAGFDPALRRLTLPGEPYGTGALVCWDAGGEKNGDLVLVDNVFELAPGCGDRPLAAIGGCRSVRLTGRNRFVSGGAHAALELDPIENGRPTSSPNGPVTVDPATELSGAVRVRGEVVDPARLTEILARR